jgi:hypothetical protein
MNQYKRITREKLHTMKNKFRILAISLTFGLIIGISAISLAQPGPPPPPEGHGSDGNQAPSGGTAPIGSGLLMLLGMGAAYGAKKVYNSRKKLEE